MKKSFWSYLVVVLAFFISCYWLGKKSRPVEYTKTAAPSAVANSAETNSPAVSAPSEDKKLVGSTSKSSQPSLVGQASWQGLHGADLYESLFDREAFKTLNSEDLAHMRARFSQAYPKPEPLYKAALLERLGILKALEQQSPLRRRPSSVIAPELRDFYTQVLASPQENWLVKRQAFRNLHTGLSETEKEAYYRTLDSKVVSLAASSEQELVERVLDETR
jgi:hypothetical protein